MPKKNDPFKSAPEFLAAFNNVLIHGFFENLQFNTVGHGGTMYTISIHATGCVPTSKKPNAAKNGVGSIVDPNAIIESCRKITGRNKVETIATEVKTENWPLWDQNESHVIGSRGHRVNMMMTITFAT